MNFSHKRMLKFMTVAFCMLFLVLACGTNSAYADDSGSKKGIQGLEWLTDGKGQDLCPDHVVLNVVVSDFFSKDYHSGWASFDVNGTTYYYNKWYFGSMVDLLSRAKNSGVDHIHCVLLTRQSEDISYCGSESSTYYAFNTKTSQGTALFTKICSLIGADWGKYIDYWILGNEVNDSHQYYEMGTSDLDTYVTYYEKALRICNTEMKKYNSNACAMVSLDHVWNWAAFTRFNAKDFVTKLAAKTKAGGDYNWGIAYHPYPEPLNSANFWNDGSSTCTNSENTGVITMYNIGALTSFMKNSSMTYNGKIRPITLTESAYNAVENGSTNEKLQAAAFTRAYYIAEANPDIKAFIIRSYYDEKVEVDQGYNFGITDLSRVPREVYYVFKSIDTKQGYVVTDKYKSYFGVSDWSKIISNYSNVKLNKDALVADLSLSKTSVKSGEAITASVKTDGGAGSNQYKFVLDTGAGYNSQIILQDYSTKNSFNGKIRTSGNSILKVYVKDSTGTVTDSAVKITDAGAADSYTGFVNYGSHYYYVKNGKFADSFTGLAQSTYDKKYYYFSCGVYDSSYNGIARCEGDSTWYKVTKGIKDDTYTGFVDYEGEQYYIQNGKLIWGVSGNILYDGLYYRVNNSKLDTTTTLYQLDNKEWWYFKNGIQNKDYTGVVEKVNTGDYYYVDKGRLDWGYTNIAQLNYNTSLYHETRECYVYVKNGEYDSSFTGLAYNPFYDDWDYIQKGIINYYYDGLAYRASDKTWFKVSYSSIDYWYTGIVNYCGKDYYVKDGKLTWGNNSVVYDSDGTGLYYKLNNSSVDTSANSLYMIPNTQDWYYFKNGVQNTSYTGIVRRVANGKYYYVENGKINWNFNGLAKYTDGCYYYMKIGELDFSYNSLARKKGDSTWYKVTDGKYVSGYTGLVSYGGSKYYVENSILTWGKNLLYCSNDTYYKITNSALDTAFTLYQIPSGDWYYFEKGVQNKSYTGIVKRVNTGRYYYVENGKINWHYNGLAQYTDGCWYYIKIGELDFSYNSLARKKGDSNWYKVTDGKYVKGFTGIVNYNGSGFYVQNSTLIWGVNGNVNYNNHVYTLSNSTVVSVK